MAKLARAAQSASDKRWEEVAKAVRPDALEALNGLVKKGCDQSFLIACLRAIAWADLPRLSKTEVKQAVKDLRRAADWTRRLGGSDLGKWIRESFPRVTSRLETDLDGLAQTVEKNIPRADRRAAQTRDDCLAALERHVVGAAKQYHDVEVSTLVSAAPGIEGILWRDTSDGRSATGLRRSATTSEDEYSAEALIQWRARHRELLDEETAFEREWHAKARDDRRRSYWERLSAGGTQQFLLHTFKNSEYPWNGDLKET